MEGLYQFGLGLTAALQSFHWLEAPMRFFTFLGTQEFFIFVLPAVYWCIDSRLGIRVAFILLLGTGLNEGLKLALQGPRPYWVSAGVNALSAEATFGIPSGHAQTAAGMWGMMAARLRRPWAAITAVLLILLIGISRIYLGVHFPQDVLAGWLLGGLTLWAFLALWSPVSAWLKRRSLVQQLLLSILAPVVLILPAAALVNSLGSYQLPSQWMTNASRAGEPFPAPVGLDSTITPAGALAGFSLGLALLNRKGGFTPSGTVWMRVLAFFVGLFGIAVLYLGLKAVLPESESLGGWALRFARYGVLGFWAGAGAPMTFRKMKLIRQPSIS